MKIEKDYPGIYKWTSPNNRVYVGESKTLLKRKKDYLKLKCKEQIKLYNSFMKHGVENHVWEVIELCEISELKKRERYWQDFYNVIGPMGMNCKLTGTDEKKTIHSKETKKKISQALTGKKRNLTEKQREKIRLSRIGIKPNLGKKLTEEWKRKISESGKKRIFSDETKRKMSLAMQTRLLSEEYLNLLRKKVFCFSLDGKLLKEYKSVKEAASNLNLDRSSISKCCLKKTRFVGKYIFSYENHFQLRGYKNGTKVLVFDKDKNTKIYYDSLSILCDAYDIKDTSVIYAAIRKRNGIYKNLIIEKVCAA